MMSQNQITERKRKLRADMKQKRDGINQEERKRWSGAICRNLQNQPAFRKAETVCFYYPLGSEVNLLPLAQTTLDLGKQVAFPRVEGSEMAFYRVLSLEGFAQGAFHVLEPVSSALCVNQKCLYSFQGWPLMNREAVWDMEKGIMTGILQRFPIALRLAFVIKCSS